MRLEKDENPEEESMYLERKNKVIDIMDDYYSRHIHKGINKPEHLFMFKAKPIIPPGKILLQLEKEKEKNKIKCPKIKVGNSEVSLFSPVRGDRDRYNIENFSKVYNSPKKNEEEIRMNEIRKGSATYKHIRTKINAGNKDINEVIRSPSPKLSNLQKSMEMMKTITQTPLDSSIEGHSMNKEEQNSLLKKKASIKFKISHNSVEKPVKLKSLRNLMKKSSKLLFIFNY